MAINNPIHLYDYDTHLSDHPHLQAAGLFVGMLGFDGGPDLPEGGV